MSISRRVFVKSGGLALVSLGLDPLFLARAAYASYRPLPSSTALSRPVLVCLFLHGGVDGLSLVVPHGDPTYYRERPRLAIPRSAVIDLDGYFGLHPSLAPLKALWDAKTLAIVPAAGFPAKSGSHLEAQDRMRAALDRLKACAPPAPADGDRFGLTRACRPAPGTAYPPGPCGRALRELAALIKESPRFSIASAEIGGWDTHVDQGAAEGSLAGRLAELGTALAAFARDLGERMRDVVVLTMSEFGRTVRENGNAGTDHGHATAMLVLGGLGGPVNGGRIIGKWPGLDPADRFEGRDLAVTTDFRDLFGEVLARHLGAGDLNSVFPGFTIDPTRFPGAIKA